MDTLKTGLVLDGLPVFNADVVLWDDAKLRTLDKGPSDRAVRVTLTDKKQPFGSARELVTTADSLFNRFAQMCGATVIDHEWGFARLPQNFTGRTDSLLINHPVFPTGYTLCAEVKVIRRVWNHMPAPTLQRVHEGHDQALAAGFVGGMDAPEIPIDEPYRLTDYPLDRRHKLARDFAFGKPDQKFDTPNALFFVDIEPYVMSNTADYHLSYTPREASGHTFLGGC